MSTETTTPFIDILGRRIGPGYPTYIVAEISANHHHRMEEAEALIHAAKEAGADAVKLQTYTPDTMTIDSTNDDFMIKGGLWGGRSLYDLYGEAYTPWDWQKHLKSVADELGIHLFSTPFDASAVDFLEGLGMPAYKVASFELVDIPLIRRIAQTGKPIIMSTGLASFEEIGEAVTAARNEGNSQLLLLHCVSAYPAPVEEMDLRTIPHLAESFGVPVGLSDHTLSAEVSVGSVAMGACVVEKHFIRSRLDGGPDSAFSLEPHELRAMIEGVRTVEKALGSVRYAPTESETNNLVFRRSLYVVEEMAVGEAFTEQSVRSIRPGFGLAPKHLPDVLGRTATKAIKRGTALHWDLVKE
jgi:pseudaminic acid synthase